MFYLLGVVVLFWALGAQAAIAPYATYEQVFQYSDGAISTNQTAQFVLSDAESGGLLQVGEHTLQIQSLPPKLRYRTREVARIPKSVTLHTEEACLVAGDDPKPVFESAVQTPTSRRLLADQPITDQMGDQMFYEQNLFITTRCSRWGIKDAKVWGTAYLTGSKVLRTPTLGGISAPLYISNQYADLQKDSNPAISSSVYMRESAQVLFWGTGYLTSDIDNWRQFAIPVLQAILVKRSLTLEEDTLLEALQCGWFPGYCFTFDRPNLSGSDPELCAAYSSDAYRRILQYQKSSTFSLAAGLADAFSAKFAADLAQFKRLTDAQIAANVANSKWAGEVGITLKSVNATLAAQAQVNAQVAALLAQQTSVNQKLAATDGKVFDALSEMYRTSNATADMFITALQAEANRVNALNGGINNSTNFKFALIVDSLKNITSASDAKFLELYRGVQDLSDLLQSTAAQLTSFIQQKQFNRLLTQQFYRSSDNLLASGSEEVPLVSGVGIRPTTLGGSQLKALIDTVILTTPTGASVHSVQLDFFADTHTMLNISRPWTTIEQITRWMGVVPCVIRASVGANWTLPVYANITNYCTLWVEATVLDCSSGYDSSTNSCSGLSINQTSILKNSTSLFSFFSSNCSPDQNSTVLSVSLASSLSVVSSRASCNTTFQEKLLSEDRSNDPMMAALTFVWMSYMQSFQAVIRSMELLAYGQLPDGLHVESLSLGYSPTPISGVDGSHVSYQCMRGYWLSVHPDTLPVTSLTFLSDSAKEQDVIVSVSSSPPCATDGNLTASCYSVRNSDLRVNWVFRDQIGISLPSQMVVIGDVTSPSFSGIYDAPLALVDTTANTLVRESMLTYLMMPAGTERTSDFSFFDRVSVGLFNAKTGSASASDYRFPAVFDQDGFPVCNIDGGLPVSATYVAPVNKCVSPFVWSGPFFTDNPALPGSPPAKSQNHVCDLKPQTPGGVGVASLLVSQSPGTTDLISGVPNITWTTGVQMSFSFWVKGGCSSGLTLWQGTLVSDGLSFPVSIVCGIISRPAHGPSFTSWRNTVLLRFGSYTLVSIASLKFLPAGGAAQLFSSDTWTHYAFTVNATHAFAYMNGTVTGNQFVVGDSQQFDLRTGLGVPMITGALTANFTVPTSSATGVRNIKVYSWSLGDDQIQTEKACGLLETFSRCWLPPSFNASISTSSWAPVASSVPIDRADPLLVLQSVRTSCLAYSSSLLLRISSFYPLSVPWSHVGRSGYTFAFWMRRRYDAGSILYTDGSGLFLTHVISFTGQSELRLTQVSSDSCREFKWASNVVGVTGDLWTYQVPNSTAFPPPGGKSFAGNGYFLPIDFVAVHYGIAVDGDVAVLYANGTSRGSSNVGNCTFDVSTLPAVGCLYQSAFACTDVELLRVYSTALSGLAIKQATSCEITSYSLGNEGVTYALPLAICTVNPEHPSLGYCRHQMMCAGHCSVYAQINALATSFTPLQVLCDPGWLPPFCTQRCAFTLTSPNSLLIAFGENECSTQTQVLTTSLTDLVADAFSPNGYWCLALKYFQAGAVSLNGQSFVDFAYRQYEYLADLTIPSGQIVTVIPAGHCPSVALQQNGDGSIWVGLTNVYGNYTQLQIHTHSSGACSAPSVCCNDVYPLVVPPYSTKNWDVPTLCASLEISIYLDFGNEQSLCQSMNSTTVAAQLSTSRTSPVVANVARSIVVTGNDVLNNLLANSQQLAQFQVDFQALVYKASMAGVNIQKDLNNIAGQFATPPPTTSLDSPSLVNPWDTTKLPQILANLSASINASVLVIDNQGDGVNNLVILNERVTTLTTAFSAAVQQQQEALSAFQIQVNTSNLILQDVVVQLAANNAAFQDAIDRFVADQEAANATYNSISTVALVFLSMGSVMGALAACWVAWPYAKDFYASAVRPFRSLFRRRRRIADMQSDEEGADFADEVQVNPEFPSPSPDPPLQSNVTARAISREAHRMSQPHLYK